MTDNAGADGAVDVVGEFTAFFGDRTQANPMLGAGLRMSGDIMRDMYDNDIPETQEGLLFLSLAYTSCAIPVTAVTWSITGWADIKITAKFPRRYAPVMSGTGETTTMERNDTSANGEEPDWVPGNGDIREYGVYKNSNIDKCPDPEARMFFRTVYNGKRDWKQFFIDFLNAFQVSGLTQGHVSSYLKWQNVEGVEGEYISKNFGRITGGAPPVSQTPGLRDLLRRGEWTNYRSTFASIVGVVVRMMDELPDEYQVIFSDVTKNRINHAKAHLYSEDAFRAIPKVVLAYAYCWNIVTEMNLEGLWSGKRAFEDLSYQNRESMMNVMKEAKSKIKVWQGGMLSSLDKLPANLQNV